MSRKGTEVLRTCLGCRLQKKQSDMVRIVRGLEGEAVFDLENRLPGRGAYVCPALPCLDRLSAGALSRTLKNTTTLADAGARCEQLRTLFENKSANLLSIAKKARQVAIGSEAVRDAFTRKKVELLLIAGDASIRTVSNFQRLTGPIPTRTLTDRLRLGCWLGRNTVAVAAVLNRSLARHLLNILDRLTGLEDCSYHGDRRA